MMRLLFACPGAPGTLHPLISLARAAQSAGHAVAFAQLATLGIRRRWAAAWRASSALS